LSVHEDMFSIVERFSVGLAEAVEGHDPVPLGSGLPVVVRVFPRLLRRDGQRGEIGAVAADLPLLRIFPEEADELNVIVPATKKNPPLRRPESVPAKSNPEGHTPRV
jgi:hypothetical protein